MEKKLFAFRLAGKQDSSTLRKWNVRDGVSLAGCTDPSGGLGLYRQGDNSTWC